VGYKYIYLVRHGQYNMDKQSETYGSLTKLGHYQAVCAAKRLSEYPVSAIHSSSLNRAKETALSIMEKFSGITLKSHHLLKEGLPFVPNVIIKERGLDKYAIKHDRERMEKAYKEFFTPYKKDGDKHEVFVCHGNIIRFFLCKALDVTIEAWTKFEIFECSVSAIKIKPDGRTLVQSFAETGHIPLEKRSIL